MCGMSDSDLQAKATHGWYLDHFGDEYVNLSVEPLTNCSLFS